MNFTTKKLTTKILAFITMLSLFVGTISLQIVSTALADGIDLPIDDSFEYDDQDYFPFYNRLNDNQKNAYKVIVDSIKNNEPSCYFATTTDGKGVTEAEFKEVLSAVYYEHPELYWYGTIESDKVAYADNSPGYKGKDKFGNEVTYYIGANLILNRYADDLEATKAEFKELTDNILVKVEGMSAGEKAYYIHNEVCEMISYDYNGIESGVLDASVYGSMTKGIAVCQGYARTLQYLYRKAEIPASLVIGTASSGVDFDQQGTPYLTDWEDHAWIIAKIDGNYYNVDITWDDVHKESQAGSDFSYIGYNFFLIEDDYQVDKLVVTSTSGAAKIPVPFNISHIRDDEFDFLPSCTTSGTFESLVGITREQAFTENFDRSGIDAVVTSVDGYKELETRSVFSGSQGDVLFTQDGSGNVTNITGTKAEAGRRLVDAAEAYGYNIPWASFKYILEAKPAKFILTGDELFDDIIAVDRQSLISSVYAPNIGRTGYMSSIRSLWYYELQNDCYLVTINPDVFYVGTKSIAKKATVIDFNERQGTIEASKGAGLNLSGIKVNVHYNDFTSKQVDASTLQVSGYDSSKLGYQDVTLTYTGDEDMLVNTLTIRVNVTDGVAPSYTLGDVNDDGEINSDDAIRLLMHTMFPTDTSYQINQKCDFNGDGEVNSDDAIRLLMHTMFPTDSSYDLVDSK